MSKKTEEWVKEVPYISVSQIRTHERNPRAWALQKLVGLGRCGSPQTELGKEVHDALEDITINNLGRLNHYSDLVQEIVRDVLEHAEVPVQIVAKCEQEIRINNTKWDMPNMLGYIDAIVWDWGGMPMIIDYKTSRTKRYFLKADELTQDIQMMVYAYWMFHYTEPGRETDTIWIQQTQVAYGLKRRKTWEVRAKVTRQEVDKFYDSLMREIRPRLKETVLSYLEGGVHGLSTAGCGKCKDAFGRNSCEYAPICEGYLTPEQYQIVYNNVAGDGDVMRLDLQDALSEINPFDDLTENTSCDIINSNKGDNDMTKCCKTETVEGPVEYAAILRLTEVMGKAREKFGGISNTWDRRETMTAAVVKHVAALEPAVVVLPSHFISGTLDPDYMAIVSQLKEQGINFAVEL